MEKIEQAVAREVKAMTRAQVIMKAIQGEITWIQAAQIAGISARQMRRLKTRYEEFGFDGIRDCRGGKPRRKRIPIRTIKRICRLKRESYADFSVKHFHEKLVEVERINISYSWTLSILQQAGIVKKAPGRGQYRRQRERRPMTGMLLHMDASTHQWIPGLGKYDLNVVMDDADGRILFAEFIPEEGLASTFSALKHVLTHHGRFCELYTDRGSHFCRTEVKGQGPADEQHGHVARACKTLGIRQILARSPQARGRSERCFRTLQQRLIPELRLAGITDYDGANRYLWDSYIDDFNHRFGVTPAEPETAFVKLVGMDLDLLLSVQHDRIVRNDGTVTFRSVILQLPKLRGRASYARCPVIVHELADQNLAVSFQGRELARFSPDGDLLKRPKSSRRAA